MMSSAFRPFEMEKPALNGSPRPAFVDLRQRHTILGLAELLEEAGNRLHIQIAYMYLHVNIISETLRS